jgi:5-methylcytosine-specific restriction enzyme subunit McrC
MIGIPQHLQVYMKIKQVYEHSYLYVDEAFTESHFNKLVLYNEANKNLYFDVGYRKIKFKQYVGVLQVDDLTIEILPKTDKFDDKEKWKEVLIEMLLTCGYIKIKSFDNANLKIRYASLIELYFDAFITEAEQIIHQGLTKEYRTQTGNLFSLKGQLSFNNHITKNIIHKERFYTAHQVYDKDNKLNQILKNALEIIRGLSHNYHYKNRCNRLLLVFEDIRKKVFTKPSFDNITYNRKTEHYKTAINLARLIILNYSPDISSGTENVLGILFDMNKLFEAYVLLKLQQAAEKNELIKVVQGQASKKFWSDKTIRPDIVLELTSGEKVILDTKWKNRQNGSPDDNDLKQMYAYNLHFGAKTSLLVYPKTNQKNLESQPFEFSEAVKNEFLNHSCSMYFLDLFDNNQKLNCNLGDDFLREIVMLF